jgi:hypothetical protein
LYRNRPILKILRSLSFASELLPENNSQGGGAVVSRQDFFGEGSLSFFTFLVTCLGAGDVDITLNFLENLLSAIGP